MSQRLLIIEDQASELVKNALQEYVDRINESEDQTDKSGAVISIARDLPLIEDVIASLSHASDQPLSEVLYSALDIELNDEEMVRLVRSKIANSDEIFFKEIGSPTVKKYYDEKVKPFESTPEEQTQPETNS